MSLYLWGNLMILNALICDDEQHCCKEIEKYLLKYCDEHRIICDYDCFTSSEEIEKTNKKYNIAFLDIEIDNTTGLEIANKLKILNKNIIIFFITAYERYIDDAMNLYALRFLKKPLDYSRFYSGLDRAIELINEDVIEFFLNDSEKSIKINANEIIYAEIVNRQTKIVTENNIYYSKDTIDYWEKALTHTSFCRIHKSFIINLDYIKEYQRNEVKLTNGQIIPIAYRNQTQFRKIFYNYLKRRK